MMSSDLAKRCLEAQARGYTLMLVLWDPVERDWLFAPQTGSEPDLDGFGLAFLRYLIRLDAPLRPQLEQAYLGEEP